MAYCHKGHAKILILGYKSDPCYSDYVVHLMFRMDCAHVNHSLMFCICCFLHRSLIWTWWP